jgi:hypothetical protein
VGPRRPPSGVRRAALLDPLTPLWIGAIKQRFIREDDLRGVLRVQAPRARAALLLVSGGNVRSFWADKVPRAHCPQIAGQRGPMNAHIPLQQRALHPPGALGCRPCYAFGASLKPSRAAPRSLPFWGTVWLGASRWSHPSCLWGRPSGSRGGSKAPDRPTSLAVAVPSKPRPPRQAYQRDAKHRNGACDPRPRLPWQRESPPQVWSCSVCLQQFKSKAGLPSHTLRIHQLDLRSVRPPHRRRQMNSDLWTQHQPSRTGSALGLWLKGRSPSRRTTTAGNVAIHCPTNFQLLDPRKGVHCSFLPV